MKHIFTILFSFYFIGLFAQTVPQRVNYQGVARSANSSPIANRGLGLQFRILQGSSSGASVYNEAQHVTSNALGIFNTQIGSNGNLASVNWAGGPYFLEVSIDTTGGTGYLLVGTQQMVSTPYALYAASAPEPAVSITGSVLTIGSQSVTLPASSSTTISQGGGTTLTGSGAVTTTSTGLNTYDISSPVVNVTQLLQSPGQAAGLAQVFGAFPNFSIAVTPTISYNPSVGTLSLQSLPLTTPAYSYTYNITPSLTINGNTLTVGPASNSISLPSNVVPTPFTTVVTSGALTSSTLSPNNFSLSVPETSLTGIGSATVTGSYPSFTVDVPAGLSMPEGSVTASGSGAVLVSSSGTNTFDISIPAVTLTPVGGGITSITGAYPSLNVNSPSVSVVANPTAGLAVINGSFPNYTVTVAPTFSYSSSTGSLVVTNSGNPSLSYSTSVTPLLNYAGGVLSSGPGSNSVSIPTPVTPSITGKGAAGVTPLSGSNFTVNVPQSTVTTTGSGLATVSSAGTNSFQISVPAVSLTASGGAVVGGTYPNLTLSAPPVTTLTSSGTGDAIITSTAVNSFNVSVPAVTLTPSGGAITSITGTYPSLTINAPSVAITPSITILGNPITGLLQKAGAFPNYSLYVAPNITYDATTGLLHLDSNPLTSPAYGYTANITPTITISHNVIQNGPASNTVALIAPAAQAFNVNSTALTVFSAGTQVSGTFAFTKQVASSEIDVFVHSEAFSGTFALASEIAFEIHIDNTLVSPISIPHTISSSLSTQYITLKSVFSGLAAGAHTVSIWAKVNSGTSLLVQLDASSRGGKLILKETY